MPNAPIVRLEEPFRPPSAQSSPRFQLTGAAPRLTQTRSPSPHRHASAATRVGGAIVGALVGFYAGGTLGSALTPEDLRGYVAGAFIGAAVGAVVGVRLVR